MYYPIILGKNRVIAGKNTSIIKRIISIIQNGVTPLKIVPVFTSGKTVLITKIFIPTGGVIRLISVTTTTIIPNQTGSRFSPLTTGSKNRGIVSNNNEKLLSYQFLLSQAPILF
jgi:hypothetical protein